jgi:ABC-2 type transport system ATP-binding protein
MMESKALEVRGVSKKYKESFAVENLSFDIERGTIFGLLGPNGAGKTTLLRMITGILIPDCGEIYVQGQKTDLVSNAKFIGYMPEERGLYKKMRAEEQAIYLAQLKGLSKTEAKERVHYWFDRLDTNSWKNKTVEEVSKGMGQKLQFVCTVIHQPSLIILDEPFSGLDPLNADIIKNEIYELAHQGATIIFSTHRMEQVEEICQQIVLMNKGKILLNDSVLNAKNKYQKGEYLVTGEGLNNLNSETEDYKMEMISSTKFKIILKDGKRIQSIFPYLNQSDIQLHKLELETPSLNEVFIEVVKGDI